MEAETFAYLIKQITSAPLQTHPYSHFHIEQAFPEPFYFELIENIPDSSYFSLMDGYPQRSYINLTKEHLEHLPFPHFLFWHTFATSISTPHFINALFEKFQAPLTKRFGENLCKAKLGFDLSLVRDQSGYSIGPHTDHPNKIFTLIFYLPTSHDQKHLGTSVYVSKDRSAKYCGHAHHSFQDFDKLFTLPFIPNSVFGFLRSDCSFHGVEAIDKKEKERISLSYTIWEQL